MTMYENRQTLYVCGGGLICVALVWFGFMAHQPL